VYLEITPVPCGSVDSWKNKRAGDCRLSVFAPRNGMALLAETARDVAEHVLDLVAEHDQDYDHDHRDQDEDEGVLNHTLALLTTEELTEAQIKAGQHA
jgi:hypothetical protein